MTVRVSDLNVLTVYVTDIERARTFYVERLGFEPGEDMAPGLLLRSGKVTLYMEAGRRNRQTESREFPEFSPCFATESVKQSYETLKAAGVRIVEDYQEFAPTFALFKMTDPDGNLIEIAGRP